MAATTIDPLSKFHRELREAAIWPFWEVSTDVMMSAPCAPDLPHIWRWTELLPFIEKAGQQVPMENAARHEFPHQER